jgi:hypothetical protein
MKHALHRIFFILLLMICISVHSESLGGYGSLSTPRLDGRKYRHKGLYLGKAVEFKRSNTDHNSILLIRGGFNAI